MQRAETGIPAGFRRSPNGVGLILPEEVSRQREVWTRDEWRLLNRAFKLLESRQLEIFLKCQNPACASAPIENIKQARGYTLRCAHKDRVFQRDI